MPSKAPIPRTIDLSSEVAIVTGATAGLGLRFAKVLAAQGASVAISGRRTDRLESLAEEIAEAGGTALAVPADMSDMAQVETIAATVEDRLGLPTLLVNNAGIADGQLATKMDVAFMERLIAINLTGPFLLAREVAKRLIKAKRPGRIVNIASVAAYSYDGNGAALYSTSKAAIVRMTETLAVEWAKFHVNVNAIAPGIVKSEMTDGMAQRMKAGDTAEGFAVHTTRGRVPTPDFLDSTLLYLMDPASHAVTGTVIKIDDGQGTR
ncbi:MAG: SDR family NAD(P)-dependent oxidoreductase [Pseudomonadota bacterium]